MKKNGQVIRDKIEYGIIRAPKRAIASPTAPSPESLGTNIPLSTPEAGGFT